MRLSSLLLKIEKRLQSWPAEYFRYFAIFGLLSLTIIGLITFFFDSSRNSTQEAPTTLSEDRHNPALETQLGERVSLSSLYGDVTLLSFWASWCGPCQVELPTLGGLHERFQDKGLRIVAVNVDETDISRDFLSHFWSNMSLPFEFFYDLEGKAMQEFEVEILPANFLLNRKG